MDQSERDLQINNHNTREILTKAIRATDKRLLASER